MSSNPGPDEYARHANSQPRHRYADHDGVPDAVCVGGVMVSMDVEVHNGQPRVRIVLDTTGVDSSLVNTDGAIHYVFEQDGQHVLIRDTSPADV